MRAKIDKLSGKKEIAQISSFSAPPTPKKPMKSVSKTSDIGIFFDKMSKEDSDEADILLTRVIK